MGWERVGALLPRFLRKLHIIPLKLHFDRLIGELIFRLLQKRKLMRDITAHARHVGALHSSKPDGHEQLKPLL